MAFLKFHEQRDGGNGRSLYWHRSGYDGAPFRGQQAPLLKEHEYEEVAERVWDCHYATFDTSKPEEMHHGRTLQWVMDAAMAGWVSIIYRNHTWVERDGQQVMMQYIEWAEPYQELPRNARSLTL